MKTHFKKLMNPNYLGSWDLIGKDDTFKSISTTIIKIEKQEVFDGKGGKEDCLVMHLQGYKPMILNATNVKTIATICKSNFIEDWIGKSINITVEKVKAFGSLHDALRVTASKPNMDINHPNFDKIKAAILGNQTTIEKVKERYNVTTEIEKLLCSK